MIEAAKKAIFGSRPAGGSIGRVADHVSSLLDEERASQPLSAAEKRARAGLTVPDGADGDGLLSWPDAQAKRGRLEARVAEARKAVEAAGAEVTELRAARTRAALAEEAEPAAAAFKVAAARLEAAQDLLADREEALIKFKPIYLAAERRGLAEQEAELDTEIQTKQAAVHAIERRQQALVEEKNAADSDLQASIDRRVPIRGRRDEIAREEYALHRQRPAASAEAAQ